MEICTIGGFEEVGKNMTAVKINDDVFIFDAGFFIPGVVELQDEGLEYNERELRKVGAIPDDTVLDKIGWTDKVRAIIISHAHLDHIGGLPYILHRYPDAPIYATPFTMKVLEDIIEDEKIKIRNPKVIVKSNSTHKIPGKSGTYKVDFVHATHSTIQCIFAALHTNEGIFFYALDLKFDNYPTIGQPPSYKTLKDLGRQGVKALVLDALYSGTEKKSGSERIAKHLVEEAFSKIKYSKNAIFITTFSSHIERLNSIVEFGKRTGRQIVFLGRSLSKYVNAAIYVGQCPFKKNILLVKYRNQVNSMLKKIEKNREKYLVVCTGHQAEESSILDRIIKGETQFNFKDGDNLIFASSVIPTSVNILAREKMDSKLRKMGVKLQIDVHVHGHGSREDMRELIQLLKPEHIIPAHGTLQQEAPLIELASQLGYKFRQTSHLSSNGNVLKV